MGIEFTGGFLDHSKNELEHNYIEYNIIYVFSGEKFPGKYQKCSRCFVKRHCFQRTYLTCDEVIIKKLLE